MKKTIKCIYKLPSEGYGRFYEIEDSLEAFQEAIGGYIEAIPVFDDVMIICREGAKNLDLPHNMYILGTNDMGMFAYESIKGPLLVCGFKNEAFSDLSMDMHQWRMFISANMPL